MLRLGLATTVLAAAAIGCGKIKPATPAGDASSAAAASSAADASDGADTNAALDASAAEDAIDGGDADQGGVSLGFISFDVTAQLTPGGDGGAGDVPPMGALTLVIDNARKWAVAGANGEATVFSPTYLDGRVLAYAPDIALGSGFTTGVELEYTSLDLTVSGSTVSGTSWGSAAIPSAGCALGHEFGAAFTGTADVTPPALAPNNLFLTDPFADWSIATTEPLPKSLTAKAHLVGDTGPTIELEPATGPMGAGPVVMLGFRKPNVVLKPGATYTVSADGLVDFAGNAAVAATPRQVAAIVAAPLVPEDGFESATSATLGGATVVTTNAIAGSRSLYVGFAGAPALGGVAPGNTLVVRLALQPGDTAVRFSFRSVGRDASASFPVTYATVGSVGGQIAWRSIGDSGGSSVTSGEVTLGPLGTMTVPLPADAAGEVVVGLATQFTCSPLADPGGMLVDDLRAE